jgi:hypothetical protein
MKKKIIMAVIALATCVSLALGGTLMLFTHTTETAANVVTIGDNITAYLREWGGRLQEDADGKVSVETDYSGTNPPGYVGVEYTDTQPKTNVPTIIPGASGVVGKDYDFSDNKPAATSSNYVFWGIDFGDVVPGQVIDKFPDVARWDVGGADAYVLVKVRGFIDWPVYNESGTLTYQRNYQIPDNYGLRNFVKQTFSSAGVGTNWKYQQVEPTGQTDANGFYTAYYYYVNGDNLQVLSAPTVTGATEFDDNHTNTPPIFANRITIYNETDPKTLEYLATPATSSDYSQGFSGAKLGVEITAYLVQSEWNAYKPDNTLFTAFEQLVTGTTFTTNPETVGSTSELSANTNQMKELVKP